MPVTTEITALADAMDRYPDVPDEFKHELLIQTDQKRNIETQLDEARKRERTYQEDIASLRTRVELLEVTLREITDTARSACTKSISIAAGARPDMNLP